MASGNPFAPDSQVWKASQPAAAEEPPSKEQNAAAKNNDPFKLSPQDPFSGAFLSISYLTLGHFCFI